MVMGEAESSHGSHYNCLKWQVSFGKLSTRVLCDGWHSVLTPSAGGTNQKGHDGKSGGPSSAGTLGQSPHLVGLQQLRSTGVEIQSLA